MKAYGLEHPELIPKIQLSHHQLVGDAIAHKLAERAAKEAELDRHTVSKVLELYSLTQAIQRRLLSILASIVLSEH